MAAATPGGSAHNPHHLVLTSPPLAHALRYCAVYLKFGALVDREQHSDETLEEMRLLAIRCGSKRGSGAR